MPTYEYKCLSCNNIFEMFQSMTAELVKTCPKCGGEVKRLIGTGAGAIFKGNGFYQTDYKNKPAGSVKQKNENKKSEESSPKEKAAEKKDETAKKKD